MSQPTESIVTRIYQQFERIEMILWAGFAIGLLLRFTSFPSSSLFLISLSGLAIVFFLSAYRPSNIVRSEDEKLGFMDLLCLTIAPKVLWLSSAVLAIGILFYVNQMKGYEQMLSVGSAPVAIGSVLLAIGIVLNIKHIKAAMPVLYRAIPLLLAGIYILWK
jgi:hypothetical protein